MSEQQDISSGECVEILDDIYYAYDKFYNPENYVNKFIVDGRTLNPLEMAVYIKNEQRKIIYWQINIKENPDFIQTTALKSYIKCVSHFEDEQLKIQDSILRAQTGNTIKPARG